MYKSSKASIIIDWEDKTLLPELEDRPLSSPEEDFTPHICHLCCCPEPMKISARGRLHSVKIELQSGAVAAVSSALK
uniref:Uncharacterized protein n=1 Tax=Knipowitschia caucasica TaxID=637954 RepID=A0AAV2MPZ2_KNICA